MATYLSNPFTLLIAASQPGWVKALPSSAGWFELVGSPVLSSWLSTNLFPATGYRGSDPLRAIRNAYCTPAWDSVLKAYYLWGGGHSDGSCNAVIKFDANTLSYSVAIPPTPPSAYPPAFTAPNSAIAYPSGSQSGYFQTEATLTDIRDTPYAAPFVAPQATHTYSGIAAFNGRLQLYYGNTVTADLNSATWDVSNLNRYGPQMAAVNRFESAGKLQEGTQALVDPVTGKTWLCVSPGSAGINGRSEFVKISADARTVDAVISLPKAADEPGAFTGQESMCFHGRMVYGFSGFPGNTVTINKGWFCDLDASYPAFGGLANRFNLVGDLPRYTPSTVQESVPCFSNGTSIYLWNYQAEPGFIYRITTAPVSGSGTGANPFLLNSTRIAVSTNGLPTTISLYRLDYVAEWGVVLMLPNADARWWALRVPG